MKQTYSLMLVVILSLMMTADVSQGEKASIGPKIVLEQEEITLIENGKEVKKENVSKKEKDVIVKNIKEKVLKSLGLASEGEAIDKKLGEKLSDEVKKLINIKELDQPKMKFVDANGNVVKELDIKTGIQREVTKSHPKLKKPHLMEEYITRYVAVSQDGKHSLYSESLSEGIVPETEQEKKSMMDTDAGDLGTTTVVKYYDAKGNTLWERQTPGDMRVSEALISSDGNVVAYIQEFKGIGYLQGNQSPTELVVVDKGGKKIFSFPPVSGEYLYWEGSKIQMSSSGQYLSAAGWKRDHHVNFFFDTRGKTTWISDEYYAVWNIKDDGHAEVSYVDVKKPGRKTIDLKLYLGE